MTDDDLARELTAFELDRYPPTREGLERAHEDLKRMWSVASDMRARGYMDSLDKKQRAYWRRLETHVADLLKRTREALGIEAD